MSESQHAVATAPAAPDALPPHVQVVQMACGHIVARALYAFAELGIADHLIDGPRSVEQLGAATGALPDSLSRLLRLMGGLGYVTREADGRFALGPLGEAVRSDSPAHARSMVRLMAGPLGWATLGEILHSVKTGETAADRALGQPIFDYLATAPQDAQLFNEMMIAFHGSEPPAVAAAYDFSSCRTIVDVGGGTGNLLTTILLAHPHLHGVLYDVPHVAAQAQALIASRHLTDRCGVTEGSFFDGVPAGGDTYLLSHILHDWDEARCLAVLGHIRRVLPPGGRVLVVEMVIPPGNDFHLGKLTDMVMLAFTPGGRERTADEYAALFGKAGLKLTRVVPTPSPVSVVEAVAAS
jgi:hypothetical protein